MRIHEFVAACRKRSGLTQQQFADTLGVTRGTVASWEGGVFPPELQRLQAIAKLAGTTLDECLNLAESGNHSDKNKSAIKVLADALKRDETRELVLDLAELAGKMLKRIQRKPQKKRT